MIRESKTAIKGDTKDTIYHIYTIYILSISISCFVKQLDWNHLVNQFFPTEL